MPEEGISLCYTPLFCQFDPVAADLEVKSSIFAAILWGRVQGKNLVTIEYLFDPENQGREVDSTWEWKASDDHNDDLKPYHYRDLIKISNLEPWFEVVIPVPFLSREALNYCIKNSSSFESRGSGGDYKRLPQEEVEAILEKVTKEIADELSLEAEDWAFKDDWSAGDNQHQPSSERKKRGARKRRKSQS